MADPVPVSNTQIFVGEGRIRRKPSDIQFSGRALGAGLVLGILVNLSNIYYGLQTGTSYQLSLTSGLLGYLLFKVFERFSARPLSPGENVLIISTATATGCMLVTAHFGGIIPALEFLLDPEDGGPYHFTPGELLMWAFGLAFFGIFFAAALRKRLIDKDESPWPGARATAQVLKVMHMEEKPIEDDELEPGDTTENRSISSTHISALTRPWRYMIATLVQCGFGSFAVAILAHFLPSLRSIPIFGRTASKTWKWNFNLSPGFIGQGVITGPAIPLHMLSGTVVGWAILAPLAKRKGWVTGSIDNWETGSRAWIIWVALAALLADAAVNLIWFTSELLRNILSRSLSGSKKIFDPTEAPLLQVDSDTEDEHSISVREGSRSQRTRPSSQHDQKPTQEISRNTNIVLSIAFLVSTVACIIAVRTVFGPILEWYLVVLAILLALPMAIVGIRSLAECDWNLQTGLVSQLFFAAIISRKNPHALVINLVIGNIASACSSQSSDIAYDFKIGSLVGANPNAQIYGHIAGSFFGTFVSTLTYRLYTSNYPIPGPLFQIPGSYVSLNTAKLLIGRGLPPGVPGFAIGFGICFACTSVLKLKSYDRRWQSFLPSGTAFAIGMINTPSFTLPRLVGGLIAWYMARRRKESRDLILAIGTGLILGETLGSVFNMILSALRIP